MAVIGPCDAGSVTRPLPAVKSVPRGWLNGRRPDQDRSSVRKLTLVASAVGPGTPADRPSLVSWDDTVVPRYAARAEFRRRRRDARWVLAGVRIEGFFHPAATASNLSAAAFPTPDCSPGPTCPRRSSPPTARPRQPSRSGSQHRFGPPSLAAARHSPQGPRTPTDHGIFGCHGAGHMVVSPVGRRAHESTYRGAGLPRWPIETSSCQTHLTGALFRAASGAAAAVTLDPLRFRRRPLPMMRQASI